MTIPITRVAISNEKDIVLAHQRARDIARLLGLDRNDRTRFSTAVSEIARNAFVYAGGGDVEFSVEEGNRPQIFAARIHDRGPGIADLSAILEGRYLSSTGMGIGLIGARRLMDCFHIESSPGRGTRVLIGKYLPDSSPPVTLKTISDVSEQLSRRSFLDPYEEVRQQNQELLRAMHDLKERQEELAALNRELEDTNRGIVALYAELDEKAVCLNRASELKTRFLSNMSHEFRTPLNSILSLSRLLLDRLDGDLSEEQEKQVVFIRKSAEDLSSLINDLLDITKIEAGRVDVHPTEFFTDAFFSSLRGMLKPLLVQPSIRLSFDAPPEMPALFTDEGKLSQILRNLISNAIKFTEAGEIRVSVRLSEDGREAVYSVADTGIGIAAAHMERIFEEYIQIDSPLQGKCRGTGLGLPLARKLCEILGGRLTAESIPGKGSRFTAVIPAAYREGQPDAPDSPPEPDITRRSVLVIEDDTPTIALYKKYLKGSGFQLLAAHSIRQAKAFIQKTQPFAVILDILLKGEDGWNFLAEFTSDPLTRHIPVFVVTVLDEKEKGLFLGAEDFATKPVDRKWLLNKLLSIVPDAPCEKVLIIDDEEMARYIFKSQLADSRYVVIEASGGKEGIRIARQEKPCMIFLDLMMPEMDGFQCLSHLKTLPETRDIPVVILTSKVLDESEREILNRNAMAILSKEFTTRETAVSKIRDAITRIASGENRGGGCRQRSEPPNEATSEVKKEDE